jgi:VanZ family protein
VLKPTFRSVVRNWWPVVVWLGIIRLESTDLASANNTSGLLYKVISYAAPNISVSFVDVLDAVLRKTGHFLGYGILALLVFFALRNTNRDRLRRLGLRPWGSYFHDLWRMEWVVIGLLVALITAASDEIHQSFIPSRTGRWQDVVIDTCGAAVLQWVLYLLIVRKSKRQGSGTPQPQLSSTH